VADIAIQEPLIDEVVARFYERGAPGRGQ